VLGRCPSDAMADVASADAREPTADGRASPVDGPVSDAVLSYWRMDVYLIPVGPERYELYCEEAGDLAEVPGEVPSGMFAGLALHFRTWLAHIEHERRRQSALAAVSDGSHRHLMQRVRDRGPPRRLPSSGSCGASDGRRKRTRSFPTTFRMRRRQR
jgi:hypothetical protein